MKMSKYNIKYEIYLLDNSSLLNKEINIDNCSSILEAKIKLETYLKRKYFNFKQLIVNNCEIYNPMNDMFGGVFGDIFKNKF